MHKHGRRWGPAGPWGPWALCEKMSRSRLPARARLIGMTQELRWEAERGSPERRRAFRPLEKEVERFSGDLCGATVSLLLWGRISWCCSSRKVSYTRPRGTVRERERERGDQRSQRSQGSVAREAKPGKPKSRERSPVGPTAASAQMSLPLFLRATRHLQRTVQNRLVRGWSL